MQIALPGPNRKLSFCFTPLCGRGPKPLAGAIKPFSGDLFSPFSPLSPLGLVLGILVPVVLYSAARAAELPRGSGGVVGVAVDAGPASLGGPLREGRRGRRRG